MIHFCVLGSGSSGNSALLMTPDVHVLIDIGFHPDEMSARMDGTGASWETLDAVVLTHTHGDHLKRKCLAHCEKHGVEFVCHDGHAAELAGTRAFEKLKERGLARTYSGAFSVTETVRFFPIQLPHDSPPTFGFRIEASYNERCAKVGYLVDLGECEESVAREVFDVDLLALEFNHDEHLERSSGRSRSLIERVLGKEGHLSNRQAAEVFRRVVENGANGGPKYLVQMHLSRDCNRAELAYQAAQEVVLLSGARTRVFSTRQDQRGSVHQL